MRISDWSSDVCSSDLPFITGVPVCLAIFLDRAPERLPAADVWNHAGIAVPAFALHGLEPSAPLKVEHLLRVNGHAVESCRADRSKTDTPDHRHVGRGQINRPPDAGGFGDRKRVGKGKRV